MNLKIGICDDRAADAAFAAEQLNHWAAERNIQIQIRVFSSAESFLFSYAEDKSWDILLLDIEMGAMDGVAMAKALRRDNDAVQILFTTGFPDYAAQGYEVAALHYLMKPVRREKLFPVLDRAVANLQKKEPVLLLPVEGEILRLPVGDIQYVEAFSHSVAIAAGEQILKVKMPISEIEKQLDFGFVRCHRSYLASLKYVSRISRTEMVMDSGKILPISRSAAAAVHNAFVSYYRGDAHEIV